MTNNFEVLAATEYEKTKNVAIKAQPISRPVKLTDIEMKNDSFIEYKGKRLQLDENAKKDLFQLLGLSRGMLSQIENYSSAKQKIKFVEWFRNETANNSTMTLLMLVNPKNKHVIGFKKRKHDLISNVSFLDLAENIINRNNLEVNEMSVDDSGNVNINTLLPENYWSVNGIAGEDFISGISLTNSINSGVQLSTYLGRLICTNGMIANKLEESCQMKDLNHTTYNNFLDVVEALESRNFKPQSFDKHVFSAVNTRASIHEMMRARHLLLNTSVVNKHSVNEYLPINHAETEYKKLGINMYKLSAKEKRNAESPMSVWELINVITDFASHNNQITDAQGHKLQSQSGELFYGDYDMANKVPSPFPALINN
ncbi:MAG: hypothetical protein VX762_01045 [Bacteroidota bacterium]|nr:hypothetical protein [Bacteroidota bacterium]